MSHTPADVESFPVIDHASAWRAGDRDCDSFTNSCRVGSSLWIDVYAVLQAGIVKSLFRFGNVPAGTPPLTWWTLEWFVPSVDCLDEELKYDDV